MFDPITLPYGAKMLFNTVKLKPGVKFEDVELAVGEMCNVVKETYGGDKGGFIAGQVFRFSGFVSDEGSLGTSRSEDEHFVIVTYFDTHSLKNLTHRMRHPFRDKPPKLTMTTARVEELARECGGRLVAAPALFSISSGHRYALIVKDGKRA